MKIEVKNFYPLQGERDDGRGYLKGGLHIVVQIGNIDLNVRGILVCKNAGKWFFRMPFRNGVNNKTKCSTSYPVLAFGDNMLNKILLDAIHAQAPSFIESFLAANPQLESTASSGQPKAPPGAQNQSTNVKTATISPKAKTAAPAKSGTKVFRDLPSRPSTTKSKARGIIKSI